MAAEDDTGRDRDTAELGGVGEVPSPSGGRQATGGREGGGSYKLKAVMEEMEVGEE